MTLTVRQSIDVALHSLGSEGGGTGSPVGDMALVAQAGRVMESAHEWLYIQRTTRGLTYRPQFSLTGAVYDTGAKTLTLVGAFTAYAFVPGDTVSVSIGGVGFGNYAITGRASDDAITIDSNLTGGPYTMDAELETSRIALPPDFGRLIRLEGKDSFITRTYAASPSEIMLMQTSAIPGTGFNIAYAVEYAQADSKSAPVPTLRLWPTPSKTDYEALSATYSREWPTFGSDSDEVPIPGYMEPLFVQYIRATATGFDVGATTAASLEMTQAYGALRASRLFSDTAGRDSATQSNRGSLTNGAIRRRSSREGFDPLGGISPARLFGDH